MVYFISLNTINHSWKLKFDKTHTLLLMLFMIPSMYGFCFKIKFRLKYHRLLI